MRLPCSLAFCLLPLPLLAGAPEATTLPQIVVTAEWREAEARDTGASVAVLDAATLRAATVQHFEEAIALVPNLNYSGDGNRVRYLQIRGTGELEQYEGAPNPSVGFLVDDIDFSDIGGVATLFDVERVEVLRGPQGTRYGANALAGLVYVRSAAPGPEPEGRLEVTSGSDNTWALGGVDGGAVPGAEHLNYRVAVQQYWSDGFRHNVYLGRHDTNRRNEFTGRARLRWEPADDWRVDFTGLYVNLDDGYDEWAVDNNGFRTYSDRPGRDAQRSLAGVVRVEGPVTPQARLVSITTYAASHMDFSFDADWGNPQLWAPFIYDFSETNLRVRRTVSQEFRLLSTPAGRLPGGTDWVVGAWAQRLSEGNLRTDTGADDSGFSTDSLRSAYGANSVALFGQLDAPLGDRVHVTFGLRGEQRGAAYSDSASPDDRFSPTDRMWGGDLGLVAKWRESTTVYARVARGYKAGGFSPSVARLDASQPVRFAPEWLWNFETGLRWENQPYGLGAGLTLFRQQRHDLQVKVPVQQFPNDPNTFIFPTYNAERGRVTGLEAEVSWQATETLRLSGSLGLLATRIERFTAQPVFAGHSQPHAPPYSFSGGAEYRHPAGWFARVDVTGRGAFFFDYDLSQGADRKSAAATVVGLRAGRAWEHWEIAAWARNLFDETYAVRGFYFGNEPPDFPFRRYVRPGDPRHVGVTLSYRY